MFIKFWQGFIEKKVFAYFLLLLIILVGIFSILVLPKESSPDVSVPILTISTPYFGASAEDIDKEVTKKIEDAIFSVEGIDTINSTSSDGLSTIVLQFDQGIEAEDKIEDVRVEIDSVKSDLPQDAENSIVSETNFAEQPIYFFSLAKEGISNIEFREILEDLESEILAISGTSKVFISGIPETEISILVSPKKMEQYNIFLPEIYSALNLANNITPLGNVEILGNEYSIDLNSEISSTEELENIPVAKKGEAVIYLKDLAEISKKSKEIENFSRVYFPESGFLPSASVSVSKSSGGNILELVENLENKIKSLIKKGEILEGFSYEVTFDAGLEVKKDLTSLTLNGISTIILVFIILLFILGTKDAFIAAIGIPISFLLAFIAYLIVGNTINFMSLFSIILSIGILVDSDIVITEGIYREKRVGLSEKEASKKAIKNLAGPMVAGTLTTIAVFFPLLFLSGIIGEFVKNIPFTIIFILIASQIISIFFIPLLHSVEFSKNSKFSKFLSFFSLKLPRLKFKKIEDFYEIKLREVLYSKKKKKIFAFSVIFAFFFFMSLPVLGIVKSQMFPGGETDYLFVDIELQKGKSLGETNKTTEQIEEILMEKNYIESMTSTVGQTSTFNQNFKIGKNYGNVVLILEDDYKKKGQEIISELEEEFFKKSIFGAVVKAQESGPPSGQPIDLVVRGKNFKDSIEGALIIENILKEISGVKDINVNTDKNKTSFSYNLSREKLAHYDISLSSITNSVRAATEGIEVFSITDNQGDFDVFLRVNLNPENSAENFDNLSPREIGLLKIKNNSGEEIFFGELVDFGLENSSSNITRKDRKIGVGVTAGISEEVNLIETISEIEEKFENQKGDLDLELTFGGEFEQQQESFKETFYALISGIVLIFIILIYQFNSIAIPFIVESVIPLGLSGVILGLFISGNDLSFPSFLGTVALSGIVVNNSIILIDFYEKRIFKKKLEVFEAVVEGSVLRLRPIILTTITTVVGVLPLVFSDPFWAPIALSLIFGLLYCTIITLFFIPIIYSSYTKRKVKKLEKLENEKTEEFRL